MADQADSTLRACKHCQIEKPLIAFTKSGGWFTHKCRICDSANRRFRYKARIGQYAKRDSPEEKEKRRAESSTMRGRFIWQPDWWARLQSKTCTRCKIELPANPAWFPTQTTNSTGLNSWCRACHARLYDEQRAHRLAGMKVRYVRLMADNPEMLRGSRRDWQRANHEKKRSFERWWREQNLDRSRAQSVASESKRRATRAKSGGRFTADDIESMYRAQKGQCWYCSGQMEKYHVDHRIPLSRGGSNSIENLVLACAPCNLSKGAKMPWELEKPRLL